MADTGLWAEDNYHLGLPPRLNHHPPMRSCPPDDPFDLSRAARQVVLAGCGTLAIQARVLTLLPESRPGLFFCAPIESPFFEFHPDRLP